MCRWSRNNWWARGQLRVPADRGRHPTDTDHAANAAGPVPVMLLLSGARRQRPRAAGARTGGARRAATDSGKGLGLRQFVHIQHPGRQRCRLDARHHRSGEQGQPRKLDDWGALRAWAWGASRALDYFESDKSVDARHVGVAATRAGARQPSSHGLRPAIRDCLRQFLGRRRHQAASPQLGRTGGEHRRPREYHWMAGNFLKYAGPLHWNDLPWTRTNWWLCPPPPRIYRRRPPIATGTDGRTPRACSWPRWAPARSTNSWAKRTWDTEFPPGETALIDGDVAYRQHGGGHTDLPNWPTFLTFAERYMRLRAIPTHAGSDCVPRWGML